MRLARTALCLAVAAGAVVLGGSPASAVTAADCQALILQEGGLYPETLAATSLSTKDRGNLADKALTAAEKLEAGKTADALRKLHDYSTTLAALAGAPKPKVGADDQAVLSADAAEATACVEAILTV